VGGLDVECSRNAYGTQVASFEAPITLHPPFSARSHPTSHGIFIRAPGITKVTSSEVKVLGTLEPAGTVVAVQQNNLMATTFHPELTPDTRWHEYFLEHVLTQCRSKPD
jgi:5'-phosphate synthase pdxT subunit